MAEACSVLHGENKRSLPAWMLKSCSSNPLVKTEEQNAKTSESDEETRNLDQTKHVKRNCGRQLKDVDSDGADELGVLRRRRGRAKDRKGNKNAVKDEVEEIEEVETSSRLKKIDLAHGEVGVLRRCGHREEARRASKKVKESEEVTSKNPRKTSEGAVPKNSRKRKLGSAKSEATSPETIDDGIELTVEDLVSIAEEYVKADEQKQHELENVKTARHYEHTSCDTISTKCMTITRNTSPSEYGQHESSSHQELQRSSSFKMTGDIAQDMLNIFLGPLLIKAPFGLKDS